MMHWGQALRTWYGRSMTGDRQLDISNDYIGYYTDNGERNSFTLPTLFSLCAQG